MAKTKPITGEPASEIDVFDLSAAPVVAPVVAPSVESESAEVRPAAPPKAERAKRADKPSDEIADLRSQVSTLQTQMAALLAKVGQAMNHAAPAAVDLDAVNRAYAAKCGRPLAVRCQEEADRMFPNGEKEFRVILEDKNGHPPLVIRAATEHDAVGRYSAVCGLISFDRTKMSVAPLAA